MFKKILSRTVAVLLICVLACSLTACSTKLNGKYVAKDSLLEQSFTFLSDNKVKMSAFNVNVEGEYMIEDDEITITYGLLGLSYDWVNTFKKEGSSIFIGDTEFVKEK